MIRCSQLLLPTTSKRAERFGRHVRRFYMKMFPMDDICFVTLERLCILCEHLRYLSSVCVRRPLRMYWADWSELFYWLAKQPGRHGERKVNALRTWAYHMRVVSLAHWIYI